MFMVIFFLNFILFFRLQSRQPKWRTAQRLWVFLAPPKLALGILSKLAPSDIAMAIVTQNAAAFDRIPGLGKKTAARLLLELKEKVTEDTMGAASAPQVAEGGVDMRTEAIAALVALGYDGVSAGRAVSAVGECARVEDMITRALREIGKRSGF